MLGDTFCDIRIRNQDLQVKTEALNNWGSGWSRGAPNDSAVPSLSSQGLPAPQLLFPSPHEETTEQ